MAKGTANGWRVPEKVDECFLEQALGYTAAAGRCRRAPARLRRPRLRRSRKGRPTLGQAAAARRRAPSETRRNALRSDRGLARSRYGTPQPRPFHRQRDLADPSLRFYLSRASPLPPARPDILLQPVSNGYPHSKSRVSLLAHRGWSPRDAQILRELQRRAPRSHSALRGPPAAHKQHQTIQTARDAPDRGA